MQILRTSELSLEKDRAESITWAKGVLADDNYVLVDTETTDKTGYICEMAFVDNTGAVLYQTLLNPRVPISKGATAVHGIDARSVMNAPTFETVWEMLWPSFSAGYKFVAWNAPFDYGVFNRELARAKRAPLRDDWECAMRRYGAFSGIIDPRFGHYKWHRLEGGHRALGDCQVMLERIREMANG